MNNHGPYDLINRKRGIFSLLHIDLPLLGGLLAALGLSLIVLYSASGQHYEMLLRQLMRTLMSFGVMLIIAQINPKFFERYGWILFIFCIILLLGVTFFGEVSKGARRWLNIGFTRLQPSEFLKFTMPIMIAAVISKNGIPPRFLRVCWALVLVMVPTILIAMQPDLGTSILVSVSGIFVIFLGGLSWWFISAAIVGLLALLPIMWFYLMHDYQKQRILTFLNP